MTAVLPGQLPVVGWWKRACSQQKVRATCCPNTSSGKQNLSVWHPATGPGSQKYLSPKLQFVNQDRVKVLVL